MGLELSTTGSWIDYFDQFWTGRLKKLEDLFNEKQKKL